MLRFFIFINHKKFYLVLSILLFVIIFGSGTIFAAQVFSQQQVRSAKFTINYNDFVFDDSDIHPALIAHVVDIPAGAEIISLYGNTKTVFDGGVGTNGLFYSSIQTSSGRKCDPINPSPVLNGAAPFPWDFSKIFNDASGPLDLPIVLAKNILCDMNNSQKIYIGYNLATPDGLFTVGQMDVIINYLEH